jgi:hypothetical protein
MLLEARKREGFMELETWPPLIGKVGGLSI